MKKFGLMRFGAAVLAAVFVLCLSRPSFAAGSQIGLGPLDRAENVPFNVENMFPGDSEALDFNITVNHKKPVTLYYRADIRPGFEKLAEVLKVKIELPQKNITLYDGLMADMPASLAHDLSADEAEVLYRITAYLDTSVGNDYQFQSLIADFHWWYALEGETPEPPPPYTGNDSKPMLYLIICAASVGAIVFILVLARRKKEDDR